MVNNPKTKTGATPVVHHTSGASGTHHLLPPFAKNAGGPTLSSQEVPQVKKDVIEFKDPTGHTYLVISKSILQGENMSESKTTKKVAPVKTKKAEVKTATVSFQLNSDHS
ncbi:hypothetical protein ACFLR7_05850 [Acidobacteriota bacterium]